MDDFPVTDVKLERAAIVGFLHGRAWGLRYRANGLLADTSQNKPEADRLEAQASALEDAEAFIQDGRHWR